MSRQLLLPAHQATTFLERGASVPFTSPMLTGARVRPAERSGLELIVPNPSGGRGSYILAWTDMGALCRPTVHDNQLTERIAMARSVTPATIRRAAQAIAAEGFAGRAAGNAAGVALAADRESHVMTNFELLLRLVQEEDPSGSVELPPSAARPADVQRRAKQTIAAIALRLGQDADTISDDLERLASLFEPIGLGLRATPARLPHAITRLRTVRQEAASLPSATDEPDAATLAMLVCTADATLDLADRALAEARASATQVAALLRAWQTNKDAITRRLARLDWLMDGWERICALWFADSRPAARREVLEEIGSLLPIMPREAGERSGFHIDVAALIHLRRHVPAHHDWRTGLCVQDVIARNEALLAA